MVTMRAVRVIGRKFFHVNDISWSYRRRGRVARTQTKRLAKSRVMDGHKIGAMGEVVAAMRRTVVRSLMKRIVIYSAIKIRANVPALYSILNPDTSSDSPSAKSNGVRLVSARIEMNHIGASGRIGRIFGTVVLLRMWVVSNDIRRRSGDIMMRAILTS